jgi:N-acetylmuramoyl-L-alanine amidase
MCIKKWWKLFFVAICLVAMGCAITVPTVLVLKNEGTKVVIDAGHGGLDGGVSGQTGTKESHLVLIISRLVGERLEGLGIKVVYTRKGEGALVSGKFVKRKDMEKRLAIIKRVGPSLVVSIHLNAYKDKSRRGMQVFFWGEQSRPIATTLQGLLNDNFNVPDVKRNFSSLRADKYLLTECPCPSVIVECGFLSNPIDEQNLLAEDYLNHLADVICSGIVASLGN